MVSQSAYPFQERGGPVAVVSAMARGLEQRGHQVTVLTADLGLRQISGGTDGLVRGRWGWQSDKNSVETIYLPSWASRGIPACSVFAGTGSEPSISSIYMDSMTYLVPLLLAPVVGLGCLT